MDKSDVEMEDIETLNHDTGYNVQESGGKLHDGRVENKDENFSPSILVLEDANKSLNSGDEPSNLKNESRGENTVMSDMEGQINSKSEVIEPRNAEEPVGVYINAQTKSENEESISTQTKEVKQTAAGCALEEQSHVSNEVVVCNTANGELEEEKATEEGMGSGSTVDSAMKEIAGEDVEKKHMEDANPVEHVTMEEQTTEIADTGNTLIKVGKLPSKLSAGEVHLSQTTAANKILVDGDEEMKDLAKKSQDKEVEDEIKEQSKEKEGIAAEIVAVDGGDNASFPNQEEPVTPKSLLKLLPATGGDQSGETVEPVSTLATLPLMGESDDGTPEEQAIFMKDVESFYRERSMEFKPPKFYGQPLNCLKLWRAVIRLGGYDRVTGAKLWRQVGESFHPPKTCTTVSWTFRIFYEKSLLEYERHKKQSGELHFPVAPLPEASGVDIEGNGYQGLGSGRARRDSAARAMQVWHGQDIFGHGEGGEPVAKGRGLDCIDKMEKEVAAHKAHIVVLPYHGQGHMNPLLQVSKRLAAKGIKVTVTTTLSNTKAMQAASTCITSESIYDDFSEGGSAGPGGFKGFLERFEAIGSRNLTSLLRKFRDSENPVACLLYDANVTWASNVVNEMGIRSAAFLTHSCAFFASLYLMHCDLLGVVPSVPIQSMPGLAELRVPTMPSLGPQVGRYPPIIRFLLRQFDNIEKADWVLFNSFHMLEEEVVNQMLKLWPVRPIGPTLPSFYLDNRIDVDDDYAFNVHKPNTDICLKWLDSKDTRSVIYVSFGSVSSLSKEQTAELAEALVNSGKSFLWVVRPSEEHTLPANFIEETLNQGLIVKWSPQLAVLGHDSVGCFISHCGWNSTIEAISLGVPIVAMPQFLDQITDAHFVEHIWKVGIQPKVDDKGFSQSVEISRCILGIMQGERREETRNNAARLKALAKEAVAEGGSSDRNMGEFISQLLSG